MATTYTARPCQSTLNYIDLSKNILPDYKFYELKPKKISNYIVETLFLIKCEKKIMSTDAEQKKGQQKIINTKRSNNE